MTSEPRILYLKTLPKTVAERGLYEAVRFCWPVRPERAKRADYVVAVVDGICQAVYVPCKWRPTDLKDKRGITKWEFDGEVASQGVAVQYVGRQAPYMRNPIRYSYQ